MTFKACFATTADEGSSKAPQSKALAGYLDT